MAARIVARLIMKKPHAVLGLATGQTPLQMYTELARMHREEGLDFSRVTTFNLDEYVGLSPSHPFSYHHYMHTNFFSKVNVSPEAIHIPDGTVDDIPRFCEEYEEAIRRAGGVDLQVLGLGTDAHIGFNEPTSSLASRTRIKTLDNSTVEANRPHFGGGTVPRHVITMGVETILEARHCIMLAFGTSKARAVARMAEGPLTSMAPASALQMHPHVTTLIDEEAATDLSMRDYYKSVYNHKPAWQRLD